jgi:hypothetical protein
VNVSMEMELKLKRQISSRSDQLQHDPVETSIRAMLVKLRKSRLLGSLQATFNFSPAIR